MGRPDDDRDFGEERHREILAALERLPAEIREQLITGEWRDPAIAKRCDGCAFWVKFQAIPEFDDTNPNKETGRCHRFPKTAAPEWFFPWTYGDDWCGEHRSRQSP